ncbi:MAG: YigZ family protein [Schleiferiaceae bacterium]|nr:YigZ family protein [Schleiferiaceae bacterium]
MQGESYWRLAKRGEALHRDRASKFYAYAQACSSQEEMDAFLAELKKIHPSARHFCWAARWGQPLEERAHDGGEPAHSAGSPILRALQSAGVLQSAVVVVRYFGGSKLGIPGLIAAYLQSASEAIGHAGSVEVVPMQQVRLWHSYDVIGSMELILKQSEARILEQEFATHCISLVELAVRDWPLMEGRLLAFPDIRVEALGQG